MRGRGGEQAGVPPKKRIENKEIMRGERGGELLPEVPINVNDPRET